MINLADARREIPVALEHLRQRLHIGQHGSEICDEIVDARRVGPQSGQQRHAARAAQRKLRVRAIESHAARGETIDVGRLDDWMAVRPHIVVEVVGHDDEDVRAALPAARARAAPDSSVPPRLRTRRKPRFDAPLLTSDLPRLPTRYRAQY